MAAVAGIAASVLLLGIEVWHAWLAAIQGFPAILVQLGIDNHGVTLRALLTELGITGPAGDAIHGLGVVLGGVLCALIFARRRDSAARLVGLAGCALLVTPYAMKYDILMLLPVAGWLIVRQKRTGLDWWLALAGLAFFFPIPPVSGAVAVIFVLSMAGAVLTGRLGQAGSAGTGRNFSLASAGASG